MHYKKQTKIPALIVSIVALLILAAFAVFAWAIYDAYTRRAESQPVGPDEGPYLTEEIPALTPTPYAFQGMASIQLAWFSKPPLDGDLQSLVENYDLLILTQKDEAVLDTLRALGYSKSIPQYFRLDAINAPGSCTDEPPGNQVAYMAGDFCMISAQHPDWFLLDSRGQRIFEDTGYYLMDPGNAEWRQFWLERVEMSQTQNGWFGVFLDNVDASLGRVQKHGAIPLRYPNDEAYQAAVEGFLKYIYEAYFHPLGRPLYANIVSNRGFDVWYSYLNYLDGAMDEGWALDWGDGYFSKSAWEDHLTRAEITQEDGKIALLVSPGDHQALLRQQFALGSYLLVNHGRAYFRYSNSSAYRENWLFPNYYYDLGVPMGVRYQDGDLWRRDFTQGSVIVDPIQHTVEFILP